MTKEEIHQCIREHIEGAVRAVEAGFQIIEVSGIVGYLLSNFISAYTNKRTDEYGGDIQGRSRFMKEIIEGIRKAIPSEVAIGIRLCGEELLDDRGGNTPEESLQSIQIAEKAGIDYLSVTAGWQESPVSVISRDVPMGNWLYIAERMKKNIKVPVSMAYRLFIPEIPEKAMADGKLDLWEMCRPMIADPHLPKKIMEDRQQDIIPCIACNVCLARLFRDTELCCTVRPSLGHEGEVEWGFYGFPKSKMKKKVMVVGSGIAGLQAAAIAAEKGHEVTVYEKNDHVGGQFAAAAHGPWGDHEFQRMVNYLKAQCDKQGAKILLKTQVTKELLEKEKADAVILATGATPDRSIPGSDKPHVVSLFDVLEGKVKLGEKVVIVGGSGAAISTALYIIDKGKHTVSIIDKPKKFGTDVNPSYVWRYMKKLKEGNVAQVTQSLVKEIRDREVVVEGPDKKEVTLPADTVVLANLIPNQEIGYGKYAKEVYMIGDAVLVRRGTAAIRDGYKMGMRVDFFPYQTYHRIKH
jgi:2,4-dienoyl-CoA reductase (NADPH2)